MLNYITYYPIFGKPFMLYLGIVTLLAFIITALIGLSIHEGLRGCQVDGCWDLRKKFRLTYYYEL